MKTIKKLSVLVLFLSISHLMFGQSNKDKAMEKANKAIGLMDKGKNDESIVLLNEALKLDPENKYVYSYEIAYAYYSKKDYKQSIKMLKSLKNEKEIPDQYFQLLGNAYDVDGDSKQALKTYDKGLKKFPNSGKLFLEKGNVYWAKEDYNKAITFYEMGIEKDPSFSSNYYRAAILWNSTSERIWGVMYGEIFMNLERNSKRTIEMSKRLYEAYEKSIHIDSDTSGGVSFTRNVITINPNSKNVIPFSMMYELTMTVGLPLKAFSKDKKGFIEMVSDVRTTFINNWFDKKSNIDYPNVLFDYHKKLIDKGYFEAYNYWLLMKGNEDETEAWIDKNKTKWDEFKKWFADNSMEIKESNKFYKDRY